MTDETKEVYARKLFGLPVGQVRTFEELTASQQAEADRYFGPAGSDRYLYAVKMDGSLVWHRERIFEHRPNCFACKCQFRLK